MSLGSPGHAPLLSTDALIVTGGGALQGTVDVEGFKHAFVSCCAAAALTDALVSFTNPPRHAEVDGMLLILPQIGRHGRTTATSLEISNGEPARETKGQVISSSTHGSIYLVPAILATTGRVRMQVDGGCRIGSLTSAGARPTSHYLEVLRRFGARADVADGVLAATCYRLHGTEIDLAEFAGPGESGPLYSGATKMAILLAAAASGVSRLHRPYPKGDVTELLQFLRALGVDVSATGDSIRIVGAGGRIPAHSPDQVIHDLIPDQIQVFTWIVAAALQASADGLLIRCSTGALRHAMRPELRFLDEIGVEISWCSEGIRVRRAERTKPFELTATSRGFYSDAQPLAALLALRASGPCRIVDTVWVDRYQYGPLLRPFGLRADFKAGGLSLEPDPSLRQHHRSAVAPDLRAAAALLLVASAVPGRSTLRGLEELNRGYEDLPGQLSGVGAKIGAK